MAVWRGGLSIRSDSQVWLEMALISLSRYGAQFTQEEERCLHIRGGPADWYGYVRSS